MTETSEKMSNACSALVNGICTNGFIALPACDPVQPVWKCSECRREYERQPTPMCMSEAMCARWIPETGAPTQEQVEYARKRVALSKATGEKA